MYKSLTTEVAAALGSRAEIMYIHIYTTHIPAKHKILRNPSRKILIWYQFFFMNTNMVS